MAETTFWHICLHLHFICSNAPVSDQMHQYEVMLEKEELPAGRKSRESPGPSIGKGWDLLTQNLCKKEKVTDKGGFHIYEKNRLCL